MCPGTASLHTFLVSSAFMKLSTAACHAVEARMLSSQGPGEQTSVKLITGTDMPPFQARYTLICSDWQRARMMGN